MNKIKLWLSAFRIRTLPLSVSGIIVGGFLAYYNGVFETSIFVLALITTLSLQILSNLANDYGDGMKGTDNEERIGPERAIQSGNISPQEMFHAIRINILVVIFFVFATIFAAFGLHYFLYSFIFIVLGGLAVYAAIKYTMGKSAYGYRALGDLMVFLFFGLLSVMGSYFLFAKQLDHVTVLPACAIGLLSVGVLNLNNMRDINSDIASQKITVAVKLGFDKAKKYHAFLIISALIIGLLFGVLYYTAPLNLIFVFAYIPLIKHLFTVIKTSKPEALDGQLKVLALSTFAFALLLGIGHIYNAI
ncbi:MAG: 1,4-dihydroxy-2-naphthoate octaprenyltransferase [Bacteroidia bacterium]|nr:1,4-dihydroxy-2-naphthoate octaprenyltransferase [Bacteroidia bacterium]NND25933.1 1,4-dihydroxy-2-naphthoate octaprenyltransferase [Flavobacteriaceae bacterium]MBT8278866.1 1,4-dihydroxy-2-naphthoate octaprenyltransferase [Bacteroidia bacterium]NNK60772.1 1,4-dihydroxy-2-naphthoate octaprenyltransferase [Flavobacteriaceae bacterium]NNL33537.1 1,4-dihydroxy-2-naphthoate octaprenyltransferase [Flavobacteriaceae bacterium]